MKKSIIREAYCGKFHTFFFNFNLIVLLVTVSEDYSRKTRTARSHLRRFGRTIRRDNPERKIRLMDDKLVVDGRMFVYSEEEGVVRQHKVTGGGGHQVGNSTGSLESL